MKKVDSNTEELYDVNSRSIMLNLFPVQPKTKIFKKEQAISFSILRWPVFKSLFY
jgi:hypothetical protein